MDSARLARGRKNSRAAARNSLPEAQASPLAAAEVPEPTLAGPGARSAPAHASPMTPHGAPVRRASRQAFQEDLQVLIDGTNSNTASLVSSYAGSILAEYSVDAMERQQKMLVRSPGSPVSMAAPQVTRIQRSFRVDRPRK